MSAMNVGGRFANPFATVTYTFPDGCSCPGQPHEVDTAQVLPRISSSARARVIAAHVEGNAEGDPLRGHRQIIVEGVAHWNLLWIDPADAAKAEAAGDPPPAPTPVPINAATAELLDDVKDVATWIDDLWDKGLPPNSAAPSRRSRRGSRSQRQTKSPTPGT